MGSCTRAAFGAAFLGARRGPTPQPAWDATEITEPPRPRLTLTPLLILDPGSTSATPPSRTSPPHYTAAFAQLFEDLLDDTPGVPNLVQDANVARDWERSDQAGPCSCSMGKPSPFHAYPYPARLSRWMKPMPSGCLFIGTGIYDSLTTVGSADHLLRQWELPRDHVVSRWYDGGHMMYSERDTIVKLNADLRDFVTGGHE